MTLSNDLSWIIDVQLIKTNAEKLHYRLERGTFRSIFLSKQTIEVMDITSHSKTRLTDNTIST